MLALPCILFFFILHVQIFISLKVGLVVTFMCRKMIQLFGGIKLEMVVISTSFGFMLGYVDFFSSSFILLFTYNCLRFTLKYFYICI